MGTIEGRCYFCGERFEAEQRLSRSAVCEKCGRDLHCCLNCKFYDPGAHNNCREPQAEWVPDRYKANFCQYFVPTPAPLESKKVREAKAKLEALFKK